VETRIALSPALIALKGAGSAEVEDSYLTARDLVDRLGDGSPRFAVLWVWGLWFVNFSRGHYAAARDAGQQLLDAAHHGDDERGRTAPHPRVTPDAAAVDFAALARLD
jgi:hypothetical protein